MQIILTLTSFYVFLSLVGVFFQEVDLSLANVKKTYFDIVCFDYDIDSQPHTQQRFVAV